MTVVVAHLGPAGTNAEAAAQRYATWRMETTGEAVTLAPYPSIYRSLQAAAIGEADVAVVPVENSIGGSVTTTLDAIWELDSLRIQWALILPIAHAFLSRATDITAIQTVYSHPQALAQCQVWLEQHLPTVQLIPTNSTTEALQHLSDNPTVGAIASQRAAQLYELPVLACPINDHPDNCTRFWVMGPHPAPGGDHTTLAFSVHDVPGALVKPLQIFAAHGINLSRIESRPTKRSLGDYLFFIDLNADTRQMSVQETLAAVREHTQILKIFGSYAVLPPASN